MNKLNRAMIGLRPGDVLTNLECVVCRGHKILVLARVGEGFDFSVRHSKLNIARDPKGPWRWNMEQGRFTNESGEVYDHIGPGVQVLEAAGMTELGWYRKLPQPANARFAIEARDLLGRFQDPALLAKWPALLARGTDDQSLTVNMQLAIDLIFGDDADSVIDERRMRLLMMFTHHLAQQLGANTLKRRSSPIEELLRRGGLGVNIMGIGPDGEELDPQNLFGDGNSGLPPELREAFGAFFNRRGPGESDGRRERRSPRQEPHSG